MAVAFTHGGLGVSGTWDTSGALTLGTTPLPTCCTTLPAPRGEHCPMGTRLLQEGQQVLGTTLSRGCMPASSHPPTLTQQLGTTGLSSGCFLGFQHNKRDYRDFH